jgi:hypothetical protein
MISTYNLLFRHAVGKSTLAQGFTVPITVQSMEWTQLAKGEKRFVSFHYSDGETAQVILRRLNNERGNLQFRYEGNTLSSFREWLRSQFTSIADGEVSGVLEVYKIATDQFLVKPFQSNKYRLVNTNFLCHGMTQEEFQIYPPFIEIVSLLKTITFSENGNQAYYNAQINVLLQNNGWDYQVLAIPELALRCDFAKHDLLVEVEFGNARTYYQDYIKFSLAGRQGRAKVGLLITPTASFAGLLCDIGRRAAERRQTGRIKPIVYSGMMTYEKAEREFNYLTFLFSIPVAVVGLDLMRY